MLSGENFTVPMLLTLEAADEQLRAAFDAIAAARGGAAIAPARLYAYLEPRLVAPALVDDAALRGVIAAVAGLVAPRPPAPAGHAAAAAQATLSFAHVQWVLCACAVALHAHTVAGIASLGGDDTPSPEMCLQLLLASLAATGELEGGAPNDQ